MRNMSFKKIMINSIFLFTMCLVMSFFLFSSSIYRGDDTYFHMYRIMGLVNSFQDGQIIPRIYPYANAEFGYATPLFYCDYFLYPFAILYRLGLSEVKAYQLMKAFYVSVSILTSFYAFNKVFKNNKWMPHIATVLYACCNYHLIDIYIRDAFGEYLAFCWIPLILLAMYEVLFEQKDSWVLLGVSFAFLAMSHAITFALFCVVFLIAILSFLFINRKDVQILKRTSLTVIKGTILGALLAASFLLPLLEQMSSQKFVVSYYKEFFDAANAPPIKQLLFTPFINGNVLVGNESPIVLFNLGYVYYFVPLLYLFLLVKKQGRIDVTLSFCIAYFFVFLSLGLIKFTGPLQFLNTFQFYFRFYIVAFPLLTYVIAYCLCQMTGLIRKLLIIFVLAYSICALALMIDMDVNSDRRYNSFAEMSDIMQTDQPYDIAQLSAGDYLPANDVYQYFWEDSKFIKKVNENRHDYEVICTEVDGEYLPLAYERQGTTIRFSYDSDYEELIMLPLTYYKGYRIYLINEDGSKTRLEYEDIGRYKQLAFRCKSGSHVYECNYEGTMIQKTSFIISAITAAALAVYLMKRKVSNKGI